MNPTVELADKLVEPQFLLDEAQHSYVWNAMDCEVCCLPEAMLAGGRATNSFIQVCASVSTRHNHWFAELCADWFEDIHTKAGQVLDDRF